MIRVLFFASIRERAGCSSLSLEHDPSRADVASLARFVGQQVPSLATVLAADDTLVAVNRSVADLAHPVVDGDEVAFYPPVTGG